MTIPTRLEFRDGSSSKFWEGSVRGRSLIIRFGRIGTDGQEQVKEHADGKSAAHALGKLIADKEKKGYAVAAGAPAAPAKKAQTTPAKKAPAAPAKKAQTTPAKKAPAAPAKKAPAAPTKKAQTTPAKGPDGKLVEVLRGLEEVAVATPKPASAAQLAKLVAAGWAHPDLQALHAFAGNLGAVLGDADGLFWLDLSNAISASRALHARGDALGLFPIADDGAGNYACFDPVSGKMKDWDHETSKATSLAPSLATFLGGRALAVLRRLRKEQAAIDAEKGKSTSDGDFPAAPKAIAKVPNALLAKFDSKGYSGGLTSIAFLDQGRIVCGMQNSARIVSLEHPSAVDVDAPASGVAYDPMGRRLLLVASGTVALASVEDGRLVSTFKNEAGDVASVSPDGSLACIAGARGHVSLWDLRTGKGIPEEVGEVYASYKLPKGTPLASLTGHGSNVTSVRFSPDGGALVTGDYAGTLCVWDVAQRARTAKVELGGSILGVDFAADGESIFVALNSTGLIEVLDRSAKPLRRWKCKEAYDVRTLSPGAIATLSMVELAIVDPRNGKALCKIPKGKGVRWPRIGGVRGDLLLTSSPAGIFRVK